MAEQASKNKSATRQDMERVREILFGGISRDFESRFEAMNRDIERLQKELDQANTSLSKMEQEQRDKLQALRGDVRTADDEIRSELRAVNERLGGEKVDRQQLGDLFTEMGRQIKEGKGLDSLLRDILDLEDEGEESK